jgi:hypothetical protein
MQDGKGKEEVESRTPAGSRAGRWRQYYEMSYEAKKTKRSASAVKKAVKKVGSSRKRAAGALLAFGGTLVLCSVLD